ncbi:thermonuclease family protein [Methanotorris formicicus]|uniref:Uncharacterized protein n=1 Tax=Methanotorris formicicus Mc-S-70 TaxID=647171 RepID=H1KW77_9EURY|nr:hypothetical protein [Methanotorris formicicus]EHP89660.1 hypothetical protein MetfoDRAFT_0050 [Methanotorris formicicus Mc-S-70]
MKILKWILTIFSIIVILAFYNYMTENVSTQNCSKTLDNTNSEKSSIISSIDNSSLKSNEIPFWAKEYLPKYHGYNYSIWKVLDVKSPQTYQVEPIGGNDEFYEKGKEYMNLKEKAKECGKDMPPYRLDVFIGIIPLYNTTDAFAYFLRCNDINTYEIFLNESKKSKFYKLYNESYLKIADVAYEWERDELIGRKLVYIRYWMDFKSCSNESEPITLASLCIYDGGKDLTYELLKRGYAYLRPEVLEICNETQYPETHEYLKKYVEAQEYAKEHKLGVWSIDLSELKN